jgi:hypothetical protein
MTLKPGTDGGLPVGRVYGGWAMAKSTKGVPNAQLPASQIAIIGNP